MSAFLRVLYSKPQVEVRPCIVTNSVFQKLKEMIKTNPKSNTNQELSKKHKLAPLKDKPLSD